MIRALGALLVLGVLLGGTPGSSLRLDAPGPQPEGLASDGTHLWVADFQSGLLYRMDTHQGTVVRTYLAPGPRPEGLAWDGTHLWCADWDRKSIYRLEVGDSTLTVTAVLPSPGGSTARPVGLAWDGEALWLTTWTPFFLYRLDPGSGEILLERNLEDEPPLYPASAPRPEDLAWVGGSLWITDWFTQEIHELGPDLSRKRTVASGGPRSVGLAFHQGCLWNGDTGSGGAAPALFRMEIPAATATRPTTWGRLKSKGLTSRP